MLRLLPCYASYHATLLPCCTSYHAAPLTKVGRAVMSRPWHWATVDTALYGEATNPATSRRELLHEYAAFAEQQEARLPQRLRRVLISPCLNLFAGEPMGTKFRANPNPYPNPYPNPHPNPNP